MRSAIKLFLVLVTIVVILVAWLTHQLGNPSIQLLAGTLMLTSLVVIFIMNILDGRDEEKRRKMQKSESRDHPAGNGRKMKHAEGSFALKEKKSGLTWGGGNIRASEATRGTKRKFLGK